MCIHEVIINSIKTRYIYIYIDINIMLCKTSLGRFNVLLRHAREDRIQAKITRPQWCCVVLFPHRQAKVSDDRKCRHLCIPCTPLTVAHASMWLIVLDGT